MEQKIIDSILTSGIENPQEYIKAFLQLPLEEQNLIKEIWFAKNEDEYKKATLSYKLYIKSRIHKIEELSKSLNRQTVVINEQIAKNTDPKSLQSVEDEVNNAF